MKEPAQDYAIIQQNDRIIQRLDVLVVLTLDALLGKENSSMSAKIHCLRDMGVSAAETAAILKRSPSYVTAVISQKKKQSKKKGIRNG